MKRYTYEEAKEIIENLGYKLISKEYINSKQKLILKDKDGYYYSLRLKFLKYYQFVKFDKSNPFTIQNIQVWLILNKYKFNNSNLKILNTKYTNNKQKLTIVDEFGYLYYVSLNNLTSNFSLCKFEKRNIYTIHNIKLWCKLNNKPFELISNVYKGNDIKLKWKCFKDGCKEIFIASWDNIFQNKGCPFCAGRQVGISNCLATKNPELANEWHPTKNGNLTPYNVTCGCNKTVWWKCKDGHEWDAIIADRNRSNGSGCPECSKSKGEKRCKEIFIFKNFIEVLQKEYNVSINKYNNTYFIPQKTFEGLVGLGGGLLSYDFYIPKYNLLIEYQGEQHEKYIPGFHKSKKDFEKQVEHDKRKKEYALINKYNFLEIWYWEFDKIEEILTNYLDNLNNKSEVITI